MVGGWFGPAMDHPRRTVKRRRPLRDPQRPSLRHSSPGLKSPAVAVTSAAAAASAVWTLLLRSRFIHNQRASTHVRTIERSDRFLRFLARRHFDKPEAARLSGIAIGDDFRG